jgi:N-acyl homoserine lactone hydrolase
MTIQYTIKPILTGWQYLDKGLYATFRDGIGTILQHPVFAWLVEGGGHRYLVDTGMGSTEVSQKFHHDGRQDPGTAIYEQLNKMGVDCDDIEAIIFTHLHWDHCYNMKAFKKARYLVGDVEYAFALDPIPPYWASYEHEKAGLIPPYKDCKFELISGEKEVFNGITIVPTPGHSPGHIAVSINTEKGDYWIIGDLMLVRENLQPDLKHGWPLTPIGRFSNFIDLWHSMEKVVSRADFILMTHDPSHLGVPVYPVPDK